MKSTSDRRISIYRYLCVCVCVSVEHIYFIHCMITINFNLSKCQKRARTHTQAHNNFDIYVFALVLVCPGMWVKCRSYAVSCLLYELVYGSSTLASLICRHRRSALDESETKQMQFCSDKCSDVCMCVCVSV